MDRGCELVVEAAPSNGFDPCHSEVVMADASTNSWHQLPSAGCLVWRGSISRYGHRATSSISSPQLLTLFARIAINQVFRSEALGNIADRTEPPISRGPH